MSYGLKYIATAKGISPNVWRIEFEEKDYTPLEGEVTTELNLVGDGLRIGYDREDDRFNLIYSRYAEITLKVTDEFDISTLQFDDERKYKVNIYKENTLEFVGWLIPSFPSQEFEDNSIATFKVMAKDTLNQLKQIKFINENPTDVTNKDFFTNLIAQCLRQTGIELGFEVYYNKYDDGMDKTINDCPLNQLTCDVTSFKDSAGEYISYYEVLQILLQTHDLKLIQCNGLWIIYSQIELSDGEITGRTYNYLGVKITNKTVSVDSDIHTLGLKVLRNTQTRKDIPLQQVSAIYNVGEDENLIKNGDLDSFSDGIPLNWNLSSNWNEGEISENVGGGIIIDNTFLSRSAGIDPDAPISEVTINPTKYIESEPIDIAGLNSFRLTAELYADSDIDTIRIRVEMYLGTTRKYYIDRYGKVARSASSIYVDKGDIDTAKMLDISWKNESADFSVEYVDTIKIRIYPGVRLRSGDPSRMMVKYKNISLKGSPIFYDTSYVGRKWEYTNTDLITSKKQDTFNVKFQDFGIFPAREKRHTSKLFLSDKVTQTQDWKRTGEANTHTLVESLLIDRLSITSKYGDIIEGSVFGYVSMFDTLRISSTGQRFLVLWSEFSLQNNESEIYVTELYTSVVNLNSKVYDLFNNDKVVDVTSTDFVSTANINESFDPAIKQTGGTMYGGLYIDYGIDAIPKTSTDPRATNKGTLLFGANNADNIELGNWDNKTLVQLLGGQMKLGQNSMFYEYSVVDGDGTEQYNVGIDAYNTHFEGDIEVVGKVSVGQGALIIEKKLQESGQAAYAEIGAEHYINVTAPEINVLNTLGVNQIVSVSEFPIEVNSKVNFNFPIYITDSNEPNSAISRTALEEVLQEENYWKVGGNVDVTGDMVFDIISAYDGEVQQQPYEYYWKINGINKMKLSNEALDINGRIKLKGVSATENQILTSDGVKEVWSLIGVQSIADIAEKYQAKLDGIGFVKMNGEDFSYEQFSEFGRYINSSENPNVFDAPWGASYVAGLLTNLPNGIYQGHSFKMPLGEDRPGEATFLAFGLPNEDFDSKLYARGIYGSVDTGWKAIGGDISTYIVYRDEAEIELKGYYYEFTEGDRAVFAGIDKTNGTYDILMKSANNLGDTINDYRNYIDTETGRWYFQNATNSPQKYLLEGEVASGGSGTAYTLEEPLYFIGNEINIREASASQTGVLNTTDWNTFNNKQDLLLEANSTTDGYLSKEDWVTFNDKLSDGDTINIFLNFASGSALYFGQNPSDIYSSDARISCYDYTGDSVKDLVLYTQLSSANIVLAPNSGSVIIRRVDKPESLSEMFTDAILGYNQPNSMLNLNGRNYNFYIPSGISDGQRFVYQYNSTTNKLSVVPE